MTTKIVCRLLDADGALLGWTEVQAEARGDGKLWSPGPVVIRIDADGMATTLSMHWCDLHVETRVPVPLTRVAVGGLLVAFSQSMPMIVAGTPPEYLPAVTVGHPVAIAVPVGMMGAQGARGLI